MSDEHEDMIIVTRNGAPFNENSMQSPEYYLNRTRMSLDNSETFEEEVFPDDENMEIEKIGREEEYGHNSYQDQIIDKDSEDGERQMPGHSYEEGEA